MFAPVANDDEPYFPVRITTEIPGFNSRARSSSESYLTKGSVKNINFVGGLNSTIAIFFSSMRVVLISFSSFAQV